MKLRCRSDSFHSKPEDEIELSEWTIHLIALTCSQFRMAEGALLLDIRINKEKK